MSDRPTIFALSSGRPPAAIAVIRISGSRAGAALEAMGVKLPGPRQTKLARIKHPVSGDILDEALVLWFPGPNSETGEDIAEIQGHGGRAVIAALLDALGGIDGLRMAEPGEFTRRGFENGKLDLTAVEGLADLVAAETESQRRQAYRQMKGLLGDRAEAWRAQLIRALALIEARIDFSDEADVPEDLVEPALAMVRELCDEIGAALADGGRGERLREGLVVAIAGPPNAGKSTLLNRLARRDVAIVSPHAGTTRDVIEVHLDLGGYPVTLLDTAGIRDTADPVEQEGVRRARERAAAADLVLWVTDPTAGEADEPALGEGNAAPVWRVFTKADLLRSMDPEMLRTMDGERSAGRGQDGSSGATAPGNAPHYSVPPGKPERIAHLAHPVKDELQATLTSKPKSQVLSAVYKNEQQINTIDETEFTISATAGIGVDFLIQRLQSFADGTFSGAEQALVTRARHRDILVAAQHKLSSVLSSPVQAEELVAEQLRAAATELGRIAGRVDVEDVLDVIFRDFCIGK